VRPVVEENDQFLPDICDFINQRGGGGSDDPCVALCFTPARCFFYMENIDRALKILIYISIKSAKSSSWADTLTPVLGRF
jgi:Fe-S-cluster-containing dehydrogenase component